MEDKVWYFVSVLVLLAFVVWLWFLLDARCKECESLKRQLAAAADGQINQWLHSERLLQEALDRAAEAEADGRRRVRIAVKYQGRMLAEMDAEDARCRALHAGGRAALTPGMANGYDVIVTAEGEENG